MYEKHWERNNAEIPQLNWLAMVHRPEVDRVQQVWRRIFNELQSRLRKKDRKLGVVWLLGGRKRIRINVPAFDVDVLIKPHRGVREFMQSTYVVKVMMGDEEGIHVSGIPCGVAL